MSALTSETAGILFLVSLIVALVAVHVPLGDYMYRVYSSDRHLRGERVIYRLIGADPKTEQTWGAYARSVLAFSAISILFLFILQLVQGKLPLHLNDPATPMTPSLAWNTAVSFVTNTNWQAYSGESTQGHLVQMAGLAVQNFVSAAVGMAVAIAVIRGFARRNTSELGNFWVDLVRGTIRILLPISIVAAIMLIAGGAIQNFVVHDQIVNTLAGAQQTITGGPVASQEASRISVPTAAASSTSTPRTRSRTPRRGRTGWRSSCFWSSPSRFHAPSAAWSRAASRATRSPRSCRPRPHQREPDDAVPVAGHGTVPTAVGSAMEGVEQRFGVANSAVFAASTTLTSTGSVDSFHDSYTSLGGMVLLFNMQLGEVAPGGVGSGLYGMLVLAIITVFVAGLMVGRTPEYLGKKITPREIKLAATYFLVTPLIVLTGTAIAMAMPGQRASMLNTGPHGLSEVLYAFTSAGNNNGSAFAGISVNTDWYNTALGMAMAFGRFMPIIFVLALAGALAKQGKAPESIGTLPTHRPQFVGMVAGVTLILVALTFLPMLALGPLAEGIH